MQYSTTRRTAFTLIEILITLSIIGLLLVVASIDFSHSRAVSRDANRESSVKVYQQALELNRIDTGSYFVDIHTSGSCTPGHAASALATDDWHTDPNCVGYLGHSQGRMTRKGAAFPDYNQGSSIADALVADGYLNEIRTDPLASTVTPTTPDSVTRDFFLTLCTKDGHLATTSGTAQEYAVRTNLEVSASVQTKYTEQHSCGGADTTTDTFDYTH